MSKRLTVREITVFAMLGALLFGSKILLEAVPNVHPVTMLIMVYTIVYRKKAIFPILIYLVLDTVKWGFATMVPYWYIFPLVWLATLALPKRLSGWKLQAAGTVICTLFGLAFGVLYAPWQAVLMHLNLQKMLLWIAAGFYFDLMHAAGNLAASFLILPLVRLLQKIDKQA